jgi:D-galactarolactone cycloisomerase
MVSREPVDIPALWDELYALMRVRGHWSGFYTDALAAIDIALWDLVGKLAGRPVVELLGGTRRVQIPPYASGLPKATLSERVALAGELIARGFRAIKYAAAVSHEGVIAEMRALRETLGPDIDIMVDLHWRYGATEAITLIRALEPYRRTSSKRRAPRKISMRKPTWQPTSQWPSPEAKNGA